MMKIKRTLVGIIVMALLIGTGFAPVTSVQASSKLEKLALKVEKTEVGDGLKLTWPKVEGVSQYTLDVYLCTKSGLQDVEQVEEITDTSYTASGLERNKTYGFVVYAYVGDGVNKKAVASSDVVKCTTSKYPLYQVIDKGGQEVYFYWVWDGKTTVKDAKYDKAWNDAMAILEKRSANKTGKYPYGSSITSYTGYFIDGKEVFVSTPHTAKGAETAPTDTKATVETATIKVKNTDVGADLKVTWKKVSGTNGYDIYMSTSKSGTYKKVGTTPTTSYTTSGLKKDKTYYFKVKAYTIASVDNVNPDNNTVTVEVKKTYGDYSKVVSGKTSKYLLNTVIDEGGQEVYFYWLWDGKSAARDENFWNAFHKCEDILLERYDGKTKKSNVGSSKNVDEIKYSLNGKVLCISTPHVDFD